jgi:hypothetical protein
MPVSFSRIAQLQNPFADRPAERYFHPVAGIGQELMVPGQFVLLSQ